MPSEHELLFTEISHGIHVHFPLHQLYLDFQALLDSLASNTTDVCCFNVTNITALARRFKTNEDPIPVISDLLVSNQYSTVFFPCNYLILNSV